MYLCDVRRRIFCCLLCWFVRFHLYSTPLGIAIICEMICLCFVDVVKSIRGLHLLNLICLRFVDVVKLIRGLNLLNLQNMSVLGNCS